MMKIMLLLNTLKHKSETTQMPLDETIPPCPLVKSSLPVRLELGTMEN